MNPRNSIHWTERKQIQVTWLTYINQWFEQLPRSDCIGQRRLLFPSLLKDIQYLVFICPLIFSFINNHLLFINLSTLSEFDFFGTQIWIIFRNHTTTLILHLSAKYFPSILFKKFTIYCLLQRHFFSSLIIYYFYVHCFSLFFILLFLNDQ